MLGQRITMKDVAARCNVSTQTVSRVINQRPDVAPATRRRVEEVIEQLGYTPSAVARTLVARHSNAIGVLLAGMGYTGTALTLRGIVDESANLGLTVLIAELPEGDSLDDPRPAISALTERHVDGIIMSVPAIGHAVDRINAVLPDHSEPVVFVKAGVSDRYSSVLVDNMGAIEEVVDHLVSLGGPASPTSRVPTPGTKRGHAVKAGGAGSRSTVWFRTLTSVRRETGRRRAARTRWRPCSAGFPISTRWWPPDDRMALGALHVIRGRVYPSSVTWRSRVSTTSRMRLVRAAVDVRTSAADGDGAPRRAHPARRVRDGSAGPTTIPSRPS